MTPDRWRRINELFDEALRRPDADRADFLDQSCGSDGALRKEVELLLAADGQHPSFLHPPDVLRAHAQAPPGAWRAPGDRSDGVGGASLESNSPPDGATQSSPTHHARRRVGAYRLERRLAAGGMGEVWLAERDDRQFAHRVAVKLIRPDFDAADLLERFRHERQVLAGLAHPHIARLFDGGADDEGLPFLAMEFIEGEPIDVYCDNRRLPVRSRLELFLRVCSAVQYAHQNLVIHRDLKPGNILVTADGAPKLLDFGIAKVVGPRPPEQAGMTHTGQRLMTPRYASPEQIRGLPVSTTTDVYSLGVILYELLTGRSPYHVDDGSLAAFERAVCDDPPAAPSTTLSSAEPRSRDDAPGADSKDASGRASLGFATTGPASSRDVATRRATDPHRLRRQLAGDLDNIVLTALRKDPERRYASVEQFALDIRRHLAGLPVSARPDTFTYRAGKFIRRNRLAVGLAAAIFLLTAASTVTLLVQSRALRHQTESATRAGAASDKQAKIAAAKAATASEINRFLNEMLASIDPDIARGRDTRILEDMLDSTARRIATELADQPEARASIHQTLGETYVKLGKVDKAREHLQQALELLDAAKTPDRFAQIAARAALGVACMQDGDHEQARQHLTRAADDCRALTMPGRLAEVLTSLGLLSRIEGDFPTAETFLREALDLHRVHNADSPLQIAAGIDTLASTLAQRGKIAEAEPLFQESLTLIDSLEAVAPSRVAIMLNNLGGYAHTRGQFAEAIRLLNRALEIQRRVLPDPHAETGSTLRNLARAQLDAARYPEAEQNARQALDTHRRAQGDDSLDVADDLEALGRACIRLNRSQEAEQALTDCLAIRRKHLGRAHPSLGGALNSLAMVYYRQDRFAETEALLRESLDIEVAAHGERHPLVASLQSNLASVLLALNRPADALALTNAALRTLRAVLGDEHVRVAGAQMIEAGALKDLGRLDEAEAACRDALRIRRQLLPDDHPDITQSLYKLGDILFESARYDEVEDLQRQVLSRRRAQPTPDPTQVADALSLLARTLGRTGKSAEAEPLIREALAIRTDRYGPDHAVVLETRFSLGVCLQMLGRDDEAVSLMRPSLDALRRIKGDGAPDVQQRLRQMADCYERMGNGAAAAAHRAALVSPPTERQSGGAGGTGSGGR